MFGWGLNLLSAWISLRLLTYNKNETLYFILTFSMLKKLAFMHLIATYLFVLMLYACNTSENVPSPFFEINRYSKKQKIVIFVSLALFVHHNASYSVTA